MAKRPVAADHGEDAMRDSELLLFRRRVAKRSLALAREMFREPCREVRGIDRRDVGAIGGRRSDAFVQSAP